MLLKHPVANITD